MSVFLQPLQTITVGSGGAGAVNFTSIPQTFTDLIVMSSARDVLSSAGTAGMRVRFNGDSGTNYSTTVVYNGAGTAASSRASSDTVGQIGEIDNAGNVAYASSVAYIPNYTGSNYKSWTVEGTGEINSSALYGNALKAGLWRSTSAINSITIFPSSSFDNYSEFSIYGVLRQGI
jgi:hypothetical protein